MNPVEISLSLARLNAALDLLAAAAGRHAGAEAERRALAGERHIMEEDRARLAAELDESLARQRALEDASVSVEARLDRLGAALRGRAPGKEGAQP